MLAATGPSLDNDEQFWEVDEELPTATSGSATSQIETFWQVDEAWLEM